MAVTIILPAVVNRDIAMPVPAVAATTITTTATSAAAVIAVVAAKATEEVITETAIIANNINVNNYMGSNGSSSIVDNNCRSRSSNK